MAACGVGEAYRPQSSSASRCAAAQAGFFIVSQSGERPGHRARPGYSRRQLLANAAIAASRVAS